MTLRPLLIGKFTSTELNISKAMKETVVPISKPVFIKRHATEATLSHTMLLDDESTTLSKLAVYAKKSRKKRKLKRPRDLRDWKDIQDIFPNVSITWNQTKVEVTTDPLCESYTFIVTARPKANDRKRMLIVPFLKASSHEDEMYDVFIYLLDDDKKYFESFCERKNENGFVKLWSEVPFFLCYDPEKDVDISLTNLQTGWRLMDCETKTIEFERYWNAGVSRASRTFRLRKCDLREDHISFTINARHYSTQMSLSEEIEVNHTLCEENRTVTVADEKREEMKDRVIKAIEADDQILRSVVKFVDYYESGLRLSPTAKSKKK